MGVKKQWKIMKLKEVPMGPELRLQLIEDIMRRKKSRVKLYCWKIENKQIQEAFLSQGQAVKNWYITNRVWEKQTDSKGVLLYEIDLVIDDLLKHISSGQITNITVSETPKTVVGIFPRELHEDLQRELQKQTLQKQG